MPVLGNAQMNRVHTQRSIFCLIMRRPKRFLTGSHLMFWYSSTIFFIIFRSSPKTPKLGAVSIPPKFRHGLAYISRIQVLLIWIGKKPPCRTGSAQEGMANGRVHSNIIDARRQRKKRRKKKGKEGSVRYATASGRLERHAPLGMNIQLGHSFFLCPEANNNWIHAHALPCTPFAVLLFRSRRTRGATKEGPIIKTP